MEDPDPAGNLWLQIVLIVVLIFVNAFFAASEIALISLNDNRIRKLAEEGNKKAKQILKLTANSSNFLATIQIGVTLAGFLTSATAAGYLSDPLARWFVGLIPSLEPYLGAIQTVSLVLMTLLMSFFSLVFGELVPKRVAMQKAEKLAFLVVGILRGLSIFLRPFVWLLSVTTNGVLRLFGMDPQAAEEQVTEEDIRLLVDAGGETGVIEDAQREMLDNVFEFDDVTAEDLMTPRVDVESVEVTDSIDEALGICMEFGYSRLPVYEEDIDHVIGLLFAKDLLPYVGKPVPQEVTLRGLLREAYFVPGTKKASELFSEMSEKHIQMAVVVDEYGGMAGVVTMEDLLESIVGNIQDEFDNEEEEVTQTGENSFEVDGSIAMEELSDLLGITFPEGDYDTLAGFLMSELGHIPAPDAHEMVQYQNVTFTVTEMEDLRIETVHVEVTPPPPEDEEDGKTGKSEKTEKAEKPGKTEKSEKSKEIK